MNTVGVGGDDVAIVAESLGITVAATNLTADQPDGRVQLEAGALGAFVFDGVQRWRCDVLFSLGAVYAAVLCKHSASSQEHRARSDGNESMPRRCRKRVNP